MSYTATEAALVSLIIANITGYNSSNCVAGEADAAFKYANANDTNVCLVDYAGGHEDDQMSSQGTIQNWVYVSRVAFFLRFDASTIETSIRTLVDTFLPLRKNNKRLSTGATWRITDADEPIPVKRNDRSWVLLPFTVNLKEPI